MTPTPLGITASRGPSSFRFAPLRRTQGSHPSLHERAYAATLSAMVMHADWRKGRDWLTSRSPLRGALSRGPSSFRFAPLRRTQGSHPSLHERAYAATLSADAFARGLAEGEGLADLSVSAARRAPRGPSSFRFAPLRRTRGSHPSLHERAYAATSAAMPLPADWRKGRDWLTFRSPLRGALRAAHLRFASLHFVEPGVLIPYCMSVHTPLLRRRCLCPRIGGRGGIG